MRRLPLILAVMAFPLCASPAQAAPGDILVKIRGGYAVRSAGSKVEIDIDGNSVEVKAGGAVGGEASLTYFLSNNIAAEFSFGGAPYDLDASDDRTLVSAGLITPGVTLQYHFMPEGRRFRPYIGIGAAYAKFYSEEPKELLTNRIVNPPISYSAHLKSALAPVGQIGADIAVNEKFYINLDAKFVAANSKVTVGQGDILQTVDHDMRSLFLSAGVGFRF